MYFSSSSLYISLSFLWALWSPSDCIFRDCELKMVLSAEKEKVYSRQYSAPILKRKSSRFGLGQLLGTVPASASMPGSVCACHYAWSMLPNPSHAGLTVSQHPFESTSSNVKKNLHLESLVKIYCYTVTHSEFNFVGSRVLQRKILLDVVAWRSSLGELKYWNWFENFHAWLFFWLLGFH